MAETMQERYPAGIYRIVSALSDEYCVDVAGASLADGANVWLYQGNAASYGGNNQRWLLTWWPGGVCTFRAVHSGKALDVFAGESGGLGSSLSRRNVQQYAPNGTLAQEWSLSATTSNKGDECVYICSMLDQSYVLDCSSTVAKNDSNIYLYENVGASGSNLGDQQKWKLVRETIYAPTYGVPSSVGVLDGTKKLVVDHADASSGGMRVYPAWVSAGSTFQFRVRATARLASSPYDDDLEETQPWHCPYAKDDGQANGGWGDPWADYIEAGGAAYGMKRWDEGIDVVLGSLYDKVVLQIEVMRFEPAGRAPSMAVSGPVHGGSTSDYVVVCRAAQVQLFDFKMTAQGLCIDYVSDFERPWNGVSGLTVTDEGGAPVVSGWAASALDYQGTLIVPTSYLSSIPAHGSALTVKCDWVTCDGAVTHVVAVGEVTLPRTTGLDVEPTFSAAPGYRQVCEMPAYPEAFVWLESERDGAPYLSECEEVTTDADRAREVRRFSIVPPVAQPYKVTVFAVSDQNREGSAERSFMKADCPRSYVWNFGDDWARLPFDTERNVSLTRDSAAYQTNGKARESVYFGEGSAGEINVSSRVLDDSVMPEGFEDTHSGYGDFERLAAAGYAVLRTPDGMRYDVAVTAASQSVKRSQWRDVTVTMRERA